MNNAVIRQNDSTISCTFHPLTGHGYRLRFDWTDASSPSGIEGYELIVRKARSLAPLIDTFVTDSEFTRTACNLVVLDTNLEGWQWRVRAKDGLGNFSDPSEEGSFQFESCVLDNGTSCLAESDLSVSKVGSIDAILPGQPLTYTLTVRNNGPSSATNVTLVDRLPAQVVFSSAQSGQGTCQEAMGTVTCDLGRLENGASVNTVISVVSRLSAAGGIIINSASVRASQGDPDESDNQTEERTVVLIGSGPQSDLSLSKSDSPDPVEPGAPLTFTLSVANSGPSTATRVRVLDTLPEGVTFVSADADQGNCSEIRPGVVLCNLEDLISGATTDVNISTRVITSDSILINSATVRSDEDDPDISNNTADSETRVGSVSQLGSDLSLSKRDSADPNTRSRPTDLPVVDPQRRPLPCHRREFDRFASKRHHLFVRVIQSGQVF